MTIEKKVLPEYFGKLLSGEKTFEIRIADWECNVGDILVLKEFDKNTQQYTGRELRKTVTYVTTTKKIEEKGMFSKEDIEKYGYQVIAFK